MSVISEYKVEANTSLLNKINRIKELNPSLSKMKKEKEDLIAEIKEYLGDNRELLYENKLLATYYINENPTESIDKNLLKSKYPKIYDKVKKQVFNRMLLIK